MKVVWLCRFSNQEMKDFFHTPYVMELHPWINCLIELFKYDSDIELHIVAPNNFINERKDVKINNIHYHFYKYRPNLIPGKVYRLSRYEILTNFYCVKKRIIKIIKNINPDIIHLHGAENPIYSIGIIPLIELYPTLVTIQGFIRNESIRDSMINKRIQIEEKILKKAAHIGVCTKEMTQIALSLNPYANLYFHDYPVTIPNYRKSDDFAETYDILFFARICKDKGIEDLLETVAIVKKQKPEVALHIIGHASKNYLKYLTELTKFFNIEDNVKFLGFLTTQQDIYKHALNAKVCVLPTYHDIIPGTIIESMFLKLPTIAYKVGGIPDLNDKGQTIVTVEKNNIQQLAKEIIYLLNDKNKRAELAEFAYAYVQERFNSNNVKNQILKAYNEILYR